MTTAAGRAARAGARLDDVLPVGAAAAAPVELTTTQRQDLVDLWTTLFTDVYVHYGQKRALYGVDPVAALAALRRDIPYLDSAGFLRALTRLVNRQRDQHTQLFVGTADERTSPYVAVVPFLVESFGPYRSPTFVVTKVTADVTARTFRPGVRVTTWNGVPFARAVDLYAETLTGGRPDARRARALATLTQRPLAYLPPPDELWVEIGYRRPADPVDRADRAVRFEWRAVRPGVAATADTLLESRTHRAIDAIGESTRRARKLLFATGLWEQERAAAAPPPEDDRLPTEFSDAVAARTVRTAHGVFGYLRIWTFDVEHTGRFVDELARLLRALPASGLVVDLRSNPGGVIDTAERVLGLLTDRVDPVRFACRATRAMVALTEADGNGADLADWAGSTRAALDLGEEYSQHLPIADPEACHAVERAYHGPVVAVVDARTYSCGDLFAAGIVDHGIGQVVSVGAASGAGGANVWTADDVRYAYHAAHRELPPLPPGVGFAVSVRRMVRSGRAAGLPVEDVGVVGDEQYDMTERDLVDANHDLLAFCTELLATP